MNLSGTCIVHNRLVRVIRLKPRQNVEQCMYRFMHYCIGEQAHLNSTMQKQSPLSVVVQVGLLYCGYIT